MSRMRSVLVPAVMASLTAVLAVACSGSGSVPTAPAAAVAGADVSLDARGGSNPHLHPRAGKTAICHITRSP